MMRATPLLAAWLVWGLWGASWLVAGLWHARTVARAPAGRTRGWLLLGLLGFAALFGERPDRLHPLYALPPSAGWALVPPVAAGAALGWWARLHLGRLWSIGILAREGHRVVDTGPYAFVRHPMYTGVFMAALGLAAIKATPLALMGFALVVIGFAGKARVEERFLEAELDAAYRRYRDRVPMLLPLRRR